MENYCVLRSEVADKLFPFEDPMGKEIVMKNLAFVVIGVIKERMPTGGSGGSQAAEEFNRDVYIPIRTSRGRFGGIIFTRSSGSRSAERVEVSQVTLTVSDIDHVRPVGDAIRAMLEAEHPKKDWAVTVPLDRLEEAERAKNRFTNLLVLIASISLVVGGIGIMNIMLATVTERTREIGIRRALGAKQKDITLQFLVEAVVQTTVGGICGVILGLGMVYSVPVIWKLIAGTSLPAAIHVPSIFLSLFVSVGVGVLFGWYPARRAAAKRCREFVMNRKSPEKLRLAWQSTLPDHVVGVAWSPDGGALAAAVVSGPVFVFDANGGKRLHQLAGHGFGTAAIAWQPGGSLLASAGQDGKVRLWDTSTGNEQKALDGGAAWVEQLAWSPGGHLLAASAGKKVRVWDAAGNLVRELPPQAGTVMDVAWRPGTNTLAVLAYNAVNLFEPAASAEPVKRFEWKGSPLRMAWSPNSKILAHGNQDATVHFWDHDTGKDLQMWGYKTKVRELAWDFTSRHLATGGGPVVVVWDCGGGGPEGTKPQMLEGHENNLTAAAWQARGYLLATAGLDGRIVLWQPANKKEPRVGSFRFEKTEATALAWGPDDKSLAAGSGGGTVAVFRAG